MGSGSTISQVFQEARLLIDSADQRLMLRGMRGLLLAIC
jgi:hypothetical protein